jgi:hypothetical protein
MPVDSGIPCWSWLSLLERGDCHTYMLSYLSGAYKRQRLLLGMVVHTCNPRNREAKAGGLGI